MSWWKKLSLVISAFLGYVAMTILLNDKREKEELTSESVSENTTVTKEDAQNKAQHDISEIDSDGNGVITIEEAEAAGYSMPINKDHWLYPYMIDRDGDGIIGG